MHVEVEKPSQSHLLMLAQTQVSETEVRMDSLMPIVISMSKRTDIARDAEYRSGDCEKTGGVVHQADLDVFQHGGQMRTILALLLGLLTRRDGSLVRLHGFVVRFIDLCADKYEDDRAKATLLIACSKEVRSAQPMVTSYSSSRKGAALPV
jgi:hypothetical protein